MKIGFWLGNLKERITWKSRCRWEDNIKLNPKKTGWEDVDWTWLARNWDQWLAVLNMGMNISAP